MRLLVLLEWAWFLFSAVMSACGCTECRKWQDGDPLAGKLGGEVLLKPELTAEITSITWKQGSNLAVQWDGSSDPSYYRRFRTNSHLDLKTGILTVKNLFLNDSNTYTPEINNILQSGIVLTVYRPVPEPKIVSNLVKSESCDLTCDGDTTDAEPVTYSWAKDNEMLLDTFREITRKWEECSYSYTCTMTNPVSTLKSEPVTPVSNVDLAKALGIAGGLTGLVAIVAVIHRVLAGEWFFQKGSKFWKADFWKKSTDQPGNAKDKEETAGMAKDNN